MQNCTEDEIDIYNRKPTFFNYHESDIYLKAEFDNFESIVEDIVIPAKSGYTLEHSIPLGTTGVNYYAKLLDGEGYVLIGRFNTKRNKI